MNEEILQSFETVKLNLSLSNDIQKSVFERVVGKIDTICFLSRNHQKHESIAKVEQLLDYLTTDCDLLPTRFTAELIKNCETVLTEHPIVYKFDFSLKPQDYQPSACYLPGTGWVSPNHAAELDKIRNSWKK